jgi:hypothetical protein
MLIKPDAAPFLATVQHPPVFLDLEGYPFARDKVVPAGQSSNDVRSGERT